jgi:uncharacterized membrane protein YhdT
VAGFTLLDLLVATGLALTSLAIASTVLPPVLDVARTVPEAADLQQRARATEAVIIDVATTAGAGADLLGEGPLSQSVPAVWPRRLLMTADAPGTAWADRLSLLHVAEWAAQAPVASVVPPGATSVPLTWHPACGLHPSCGFRRGDLVIIYSRSGALAITSLAGVQGRLLALATPPDQAIGLPAVAAVLSVTTFSFDDVRRQVRRAEAAAASQPVTDDVVGMRVRYYGGSAAPRWPAVPGAETCAVDADGQPKLGLLGPVPGPPVELTLADLADGPWCGAGHWRFDADLLRIRAVRVALRLQARSPGVRGVAPEWFAMPGQARWPRQEVRDVELDVFATAPNLAGAQ